MLPRMKEKQKQDQRLWWQSYYSHIHSKSWSIASISNTFIKFACIRRLLRLSVYVEHDRTYLLCYRCYWLVYLFVIRVKSQSYLRARTVILTEALIFSLFKILCSPQFVPFVPLQEKELNFSSSNLLSELFRSVKRCFCAKNAFFKSDGNCLRNEPL